VERDITTRGEYQLTDALQLMLEAGTVFEPYAVEGWFDCGTPEILLETNRALLDRVVAAPMADGGAAGRSAVIVPPVHIGAGVELEEAVLGPYVAVGDGSRVTRSVLRDTILGRAATVHGAVLERAIVGDGARVEGSPVTGLAAPGGGHAEGAT
jgi:glucose-1-phosphate thymidylyltransferase